MEILTESRQSGYFILEPKFQGDGMLLGAIPRAPGRQSWTVGARFMQPPPTPVVASIQAGYEDALPLPYMSIPPIISDETHAVLVSAGVTNLDVYDAVLRSQDGRVEITGYKAFNVIGLIAAADLAASAFAADNRSRLLDASFDSLVIDPTAVRGALMFRLAEFSSAVVVHCSVRNAIEAAGLTRIGFVSPENYIS